MDTTVAAPGIFKRSPQQRFLLQSVFSCPMCQAVSTLSTPTISSLFLFLFLRRSSCPQLKPQARQCAGMVPDVAQDDD